MEKISTVLNTLKKESDDYLMVHEKKCHSIFKKIEQAEVPLYVCIERDMSENELISLDDTQYVRISLLTDEILEYDIEMFQSQNSANFSKKYRPYFLSFIASLEQKTLSDINLLGDSWYFGEITNQEENFTGEGTLLKGVLETSASPINYLDTNLLIFTNRTISVAILNKINTTYSLKDFETSNSSDVAEVLNNAWKEDFPQKIDVYNVGHGNADYIRGIFNRILYDIGYNYRSFPKRNNSKYLRAVNAIRYLKPSCVILSHWDMDHIIGCAYAEQSIFTVKWIAPHLISAKDKKPTKNSIRLANYLKVLGNLCLVDREQDEKLIATINCANEVQMNLWLGSGASKLSYKNNEGLMIEILHKGKVYPNILLAGDVPYKCMPNLLNKQIDFIHVPHHCSNMELDALKGLCHKGECAIISTNREKDGNLNQNSFHYDELVKKFNSVIHTIDNSLKNDEANLSVQINYCERKFYFR